VRRLRSKVLLALGSLGVLVSVSAAQSANPDREFSGGGWMGLYIRTVDHDDIEALNLNRNVRGVVVSGVDDEGPAAKARIEPGDVITEFDGRRVDNRRDFMVQLDSRAPGDKVNLKVIRDSGEKSLSFELSERPRELEGRASPTARLLYDTRRATSALAGPTLGVHTLDLTNPALAEYFGVDARGGVLVTDVIADSGAEAAGIQGGDVILAIEDQTVHRVEHVQEALAEHEPGDRIAVRIRRKKNDQTVEVELGEPSVISFSGLNIPRVPYRSGIVGDDVSDLRREVRELKRDLQRLEREMRRR